MPEEAPEIVVKNCLEYFKAIPLPWVKDKMLILKSAKDGKGRK